MITRNNSIIYVLAAPSGLVLGHMRVSRLVEIKAMEDFNDALIKPIDEIMFILLGQGVLRSNTHPDVESARAIDMTSVEAVHSRLKIEQSPNYAVLDYVEQAKKEFQVLRGME